MKHLLLTLVMAVSLLTGCDTVNNKVTPAYRVYINLSGLGVWNTYGVAGVGDYRIFSRAKGLPNNYSYTVNTYTGFSGVLLIMALDTSTGSYAPQAFEICCPVENDVNVTVSIDSKTLDAVCPNCGSHYNVLTGMGGPSSGRASSENVGLRNYKVRESVSGGYVITSS